MVDLDKELFGSILRQAIFERGMTQSGLARIIGVTPNSIQNYLTGASFPSLDVFARIVKALNYSADYLLGFTAPRDLDGNPDELNEEILIMRSSYTSMTPKQKKAFLDFVRSLAKN
jgi:transcriptional regulator with XRE-family HTH domain